MFDGNFVGVQGNELSRKKMYQKLDAHYIVDYTNFVQKNQLNVLRRVSCGKIST